MSDQFCRAKREAVRLLLNGMKPEDLADDVVYFPDFMTSADRRHKVMDVYDRFRNDSRRTHGYAVSLFWRDKTWREVAEHLLRRASCHRGSRRN